MTIKSVVADYEADLEYANPILWRWIRRRRKGKIWYYISHGALPGRRLDEAAAMVDHGESGA